MIRRALTFSLLCALALIACAARAEACTCVGPNSACAAFGHAAAAFVGTVTDLKRPSRGEAAQEEYARPVATFAVEEAFAGVEGAQVSVEGGSGADCGYSFDKGTRYLVYARRERGGGLYAGLCSRTMPAEGAADDIKFLRTLVRRRQSATISGRAGRWLMEWDAGGVRKVAPVEGVRVTAESRAGAHEAVIDERGRYELAGLPPGRYDVVIHLREGLTVREPRRLVEAVAGGCAAADFVVLDDGRVGGRVLDAEGRPVPGVTVTMVEADDKTPYSGSARHEPADAEGRYKFSALPPGRYLLGVRLVPPARRDDPAAAFPRTYYPGVARADEADVLELKAGEELAGRDLLLPPRLAESVIRVRVVWDDGAPVPNAHVLYRETTYGDNQFEQGTPADELGQFEIKTRVGAVFQIRASAPPPAGEPQGTGSPATSEPLTLNVAGPAEHATLVVRRLR